MKIITEDSEEMHLNVIKPDIR